MKTVKVKLVFVLLVAIVTLGGCKTTEPLYYYGSFNEAVYSYFKADEVSISQQIEEIEKTISESGDRAIPPGLHAHLGMLYIEVGNEEAGLQHLRLEKELFPEASHFIDFLLNTKKAGEA